jgi:histidinol phosphatase-like enzyme
MIEAAKQAYPMIDLSKSIVVGDKQSDMQLARNVYANAVLVADHEPNIRNSLVDAKFKNLFEFARSI